MGSYCPNKERKLLSSLRSVEASGDAHFAPKVIPLTDEDHGRGGEESPSAWYLEIVSSPPP